MSDSSPPSSDKHASLNNSIQAAALILNSVALILVAATFVANCQEAESTRESTRLLAESNEIRDRPWVALSSFEGGALSCDASVSLRWKLQNAGPVPALVVVSHVRTFTANADPTWDQILKRKAVTSLGYISPGNEINLAQVLDIPCDEYEYIEHGSRRFFACLHVEYTGPSLRDFSFAACNVYTVEDAAWTLLGFSHELMGESSFASKH